jgi:hypothetical protein
MLFCCVSWKENNTQIRSIFAFKSRIIDFEKALMIKN